MFFFSEQVSLTDRDLLQNCFAILQMMDCTLVQNSDNVEVETPITTKMERNVIEKQVFVIPGWDASANVICDCCLTSDL